MIVSGPASFFVTALRFSNKRAEFFRSLDHSQGTSTLSASHTRPPRDVESSRARIFIETQSPAEFPILSQKKSSALVREQIPGSGRPIRSRRYHRQKSSHRDRVARGLVDFQREKDRNGKQAVALFDTHGG